MTYGIYLKPFEIKSILDLKKTVRRMPLHLCFPSPLKLKKGDILWVKEAWQLVGWDFFDGEMNIKYSDGSVLTRRSYDPKEDDSWLLDKIYQLESDGIIVADDKVDETNYTFTDKPYPFYHAISMPKELSRLRLKILEVTDGKVSEITEAEAKEEGAELFYYKGAKVPSYKAGFTLLYNSVFGADSHTLFDEVKIIKFSIVIENGSI